MACHTKTTKVVKWKDLFQVLLSKTKNNPVLYNPTQQKIITIPEVDVVNKVTQRKSMGKNFDFRMIEINYKIYTYTQKKMCAWLKRTFV